MSLPAIAVQLYSVREALAQDFESTVRRIADMGYAGVETAGFPGTTAEKAAALFEELGLAVPSAHAPLPLGDKQTSVLETMSALGCKRLVNPAMPRDMYQDVAGVLKVCEMLNEAYQVCAANGISLGVHNHWWEFEPVDGTLPYELYLENLEPDIFFQLDTYWIRTAGLDPAKFIKELGPRAPLLHIKDGPATKEAPMVAVGQGVMDLQAIASAAAGHADWWIVELDRCASDMLTAVEVSFNYLIDAGLAQGKPTGALTS